MNGIGVTVNGETIRVTGKDDVLSVFETETGLTEEEQLEEWVVDSIDTEFDYDSAEDKDILRAVVYFTPLDTVNSGWIQDSDLEFEKWSRKDYSLKDDQLGVTYERIM